MGVGVQLVEHAPRFPNCLQDPVELLFDAVDDDDEVCWFACHVHDHVHEWIQVLRVCTTEIQLVLDD